MGNTFEVWSYVKSNALDVYEYALVYNGESFQDALQVMMEEKKKGVGCVKFEWR